MGSALAREDYLSRGSSRVSRITRATTATTIDIDIVSIQEPPAAWLCCFGLEPCFFSWESGVVHFMRLVCWPIGLRRNQYPPCLSAAALPQSLSKRRRSRCLGPGGTSGLSSTVTSRERKCLRLCVCASSSTLTRIIENMKSISLRHWHRWRSVASSNR